MVEGTIERWWELELADRFQIATSRHGASAVFHGGDTDHIDGVSTIERAYDVIRHLEGTWASDRSREDRLVRWLLRLIAPDGRPMVQEELERIAALRDPEAAARRERELRVAWRHAVPWLDAPVTGPHSDLADADYLVRCLASLAALPRETPLIAWIRGRQSPDGAFRAPLSLDANGAPHGDALADTAHALRALGAFSATPRDRDACVLWLRGAALGVPLDDLVRWLDVVEAAHHLGAIELYDAHYSAVLPFLELTDGERVGFDLYAAVRIIELLKSGRAS
ncbi:MAG: hypothetical protein KF773_02555 [Deltaproteobacteria bacterium]|nr:hypothetical protein [Deltaproteobacteria bacterium]